MNPLFEKAKKIFQTEEDQEYLRQEEARARELEQIRQTMLSEGGQSLKKVLRSEITSLVDKLIETREPHLISDLKANLNLYNKLKTDDELDAINRELEDMMK
jgi:shikimate kinase